MPVILRSTSRSGLREPGRRLAEGTVHGQVTYTESAKGQVGTFSTEARLLSQDKMTLYARGMGQVPALGQSSGSCMCPGACMLSISLQSIATGWRDTLSCVSCAGAREEGCKAEGCLHSAGEPAGECTGR